MALPGGRPDAKRGTRSQHAAAQQYRPVQVSPARSLLVLIVMLLCGVLITGRMTFWSVFAQGQLTQEIAQQNALAVQKPQRGQILDSNGNALAMNVTRNVVYAVPRDIKDAYRTAVLLAPVLHQPQKTLIDLFSSKSAGYLLLTPHPIGANMSRLVNNLALPGIILTPELHRIYPEGSLGSQVLGFANLDNQGSYGLEGYYDKLLSGQAGLRSVLRDTAGNDIHLASTSSSPAHDGADLYLSLDRTVQGLAEDELQKAVKAHNADGGTVIVMQPSTGYILAMASTPTYNPNQYWKYGTSVFNNNAIQWDYEPGSTFKIVTMAAGLDTGVITPQSTLNDTGEFHIADAVIHNWNMSGFGLENMTQVLQHSANVGAAWVAGRLGVDNFYKYLRRFGFERSTGVDLQGEGTSILPLPGDKTWTIVNLYTNSFGQGISVTPLQMITAVSAVANGGILMKPQLVKRLVYDGRVIDRPPVSRGRVISAATAHTLTDMLLHSAIGGEASEGLVKGYDIAAKTGTANIAGANGQYLSNATIGSIVGYAPAFHPKFVALVILNHPRDQIWGSMTAAPVLHNLFHDLFMYYRIPPDPSALNK